MSIRRFRVFLTGLGIVTLMAIAAGWLTSSRWAKQDSPRESLSIGLADVIHAMPAIIAEEKGFFRDEGLDVTVRHFPNGKPALEAQLRGELDVATVAETPVVFYSFTRRDFVILASFIRSRSEGRLVVHPQSGINTMADLRGHRVGVIAGTTAHFFLHVMLTDNGLAPGDITEVPIPVPDIIPALMARKVDAIAVFEPLGLQAQAALPTPGKQFDSGGRVAISFLYTAARDFPERRSTAAKRLLAATDKAIDWIHGHRDETIAVISRRTNLDPQIVASLLDAFTSRLSLDQALLMSLEEQARWALQAGLVKPGPIPNYLEFIDASALRAVKPEVVLGIH